MPLTHRYFLGLIFVFFLTVSLSAQEKKRIDYQSNILYTTAELGPDIKILTDSVIFFHEGSEMRCDSAQFNPSADSFKAFGHIEIIKPNEEEQDTVFLYGDSLRYSGQSKMAVIRSNVILIKDSLTLMTDSLDYDLNTNIGYYPQYATTVNGEDTLKSKEGYYYSDKNELFFKDSVEVINPRFKMYSDTLKHNTKEKISYFFGPTDIISDSNYIYCEKGWYDHEKDLASVSKNAFLQNKEKTMRGDSLYYDRKNGFGKAYYNVSIRDTLKDLLLLGNHGSYDELHDISFMTDQALFIQAEAPGDSLFMHGDTLIAHNDTIRVTDINDKGEEFERDSIYRVVQAYRHVKIYKSDFQAKCDSVIYSFRDSVMEMHGEPVVWSEENQLTAQKIIAYTKNKSITQVDLDTDAFVISQSDSVRFDQVKGKKMIGYIDNDELYRIDVVEEGESLYFARDSEQKLIGVNRITCKNMIIYLEDQKIDHIWFYENPKGTMTPPFVLTPEETKLDKFAWYENIRPQKKEDVLIWEQPEK